MFQKDRARSYICTLSDERMLLLMKHIDLISGRTYNLRVYKCISVCDKSAIHKSVYDRLCLQEGKDIKQAIKCIRQLVNYQS